MILSRLKALIHRLSTRGIRGDNSQDVTRNVILYYIRDPKRQSGVMIRQDAEVYRDRREFKMFIAIQILYYEIYLNRRKQNART